RPETRTTANTVSKVTSTTLDSWNSFQASKYQRVVQPAGSQVPSQRVAKELRMTAAITPTRLRTKSPVTAQTAKRQIFDAGPRSRIMALPFGGWLWVAELCALFLGLMTTIDGETALPSLPSSRPRAGIQRAQVLARKRLSRPADAGRLDPGTSPG